MESERQRPFGRPRTQFAWLPWSAPIASHKCQGGVNGGPQSSSSSFSCFFVWPLVQRVNTLPMSALGQKQTFCDYLQNVRFRGATSTGRCNTSVKSFRRRFKLQRLTWSFVELTRYFVQLCLRVYRQVRSLDQFSRRQSGKLMNFPRSHCRLPESSFRRRLSMEKGAQGSVGFLLQAAKI